MSTDVVISFDTTGSMYPALTEVRRKVSEIVKILFDEVTDLRIGIIAHGDYCDSRSSYVTKQFQLSNDRSSLVNFVNTVEKTGGGDADECYELVLKQVRGFNWEADTRAFILIGDCEPHEQGYRYGEFRVDFDWRDITREIITSGVTIYPVQALDNSGGKLYSYLAKASGTPHLRLHQFSNLIQLLTAVVYKQVSNERLTAYGQELQVSGVLNRNLAQVIDSLLQEKVFIGTDESTRETGDLEAVPPWRFQILSVDKITPIRDFVEYQGIRYKVGRGFYELTKAEEIQERKEVILVHKSGDMFTGKKARELLGLPYGERGKRYAKNVPVGYTAFVQSTSVNRKLMPGTKFLYEP